LADAGLLWIKAAGKRSADIIPEEKLVRCDTCSVPDVYLIVADAYPGRLQFKNIFDYDNSLFEASLKQRGFYIADSSLSNKTMFLNLNAIFFPGRDYSGVYPGISNVNLFRLVLNKHFGQQLPLLKDSTIYLTD